MTNNNIKIINNTQFNGIELYFDTIPNKTIITELKTLKFRWHSMKKCWYNKATTEIKNYVEKLANSKIEANTITEQQKNCTKKAVTDTIELKTLKKLTGTEKIEAIKKDWATDRMIEFIDKQYDYYQTTDNLIIEIEKANKLSITKTLYYNDETDAPQINFENFLRYNDSVFERFEYITEKMKICNHYWYFAKQNNSISYIQDLTSYELQEKQYLTQFNVRELTEDEKQDYLTILKARNDEYLTRLKKYFDKYKDKITIMGYWANR